MKKVVVASASWCSQCGPYKKALENSGVEFETCDVDDMDQQAFLTKMGVRGLPTTLIFADDVLIGTVTGNNVKKVQELLGV